MNLLISAWKKLKTFKYSLKAHTSMNPPSEIAHEITENQLIELMKDMNHATCKLHPCSCKLYTNSWMYLKEP